MSSWAGLPNMADADKIKSRFQTAKSKRQPIEAQLDRAYHFTNPTGSPLHITDQAVSISDQFDSTAAEAVKNFVKTLIDFMFPQQEKWVGFGMSARYVAAGLPTGQFDVLLAGQQAILLEEIEESCFYLALSESLEDWFIGGSGGIGIQIKDDGLYYKSLPMKQLFYLDNGDGVADVVFRCHSLPARTVVANWKRAPKWVHDLAERKPDDLVEIVEASLPTNKPGQFEYSVWTAKDWAECYSQNCKFQPFIVYRMDLSTGETYGNSIVRRALPEIETLSLITADMTDASALAARPPMLTNSLELKDVKLEAGRVYYIGDNEFLKPLEMSGRGFEAGPIMIERLQQSIRRQLMADILPAGSTSDRMTQAEVQLRQSEFFRRLGVYAIRLEEELLEPLVRATIIALQNKGRLDRKQLKLGPRDDIRLVLNSLKKQMKAQAESDNIVGSVLLLAQFQQAASQAGPLARHIDMVKAPRYLLSARAFPPELLVPETEVQAAIEAQQGLDMMNGMSAAQNGQASPETNKAAGEAAGALLPKLMGQQ